MFTVNPLAHPPPQLHALLTVGCSAAHAARPRDLPPPLALC
eukprot:COSAG06_NODE_63413_length_261_cov_0.779141_1_plen_40_part_01